MQNGYKLDIQQTKVCTVHSTSSPVLIYPIERCQDPRSRCHSCLKPSKPDWSSHQVNLQIKKGSAKFGNPGGPWEYSVCFRYWPTASGERLISKTKQVYSLNYEIELAARSSEADDLESMRSYNVRDRDSYWQASDLRRPQDT